MKPSVILLLSFFVLSCKEDTLVPARDIRCGTPCYLGNPVQAGVGVCSKGTWQCDEKGDLTVCFGWAPPSNPTCNGYDNDCDGSVDQPYQACTSACGTGIQECVDGSWSECSVKGPVQEECNGHDDDCDGVVDNPDKVPVVYCYDGPAGTLIPGSECSPGLRACRNGSYGACLGQKLPREEICDGRDNDCDILIDEGMDKSEDIIFMIDFSGSMADKINAVLAAISGWAQSRSTSEYRFALVAVPAPERQYEAQVTLVQDFTDISNFMRALREKAQLVPTSQSALENTLDAVHMVANQSNPLVLSWRPNTARVGIMVADEPSQSILSSRTATTVAAEVGSANPLVQFNFFVKDEYSLGYSPIATATGGRTLSISLPPESMQRELDSIVNGVGCR